MSTQIVGRIRKYPKLYRAVRQTVFGLRRFLPPQRVPELPGRVHPNDFMTNRLIPFPGSSIEDYMRDSRRHFEIVSDYLDGLGRKWSDINAMIDFGCGYGRVTRWFTTVLAPERITACDVQMEPVRFCEREFGVRGLIAKPEIHGTAFKTYDLLVGISVLTHLSPRRIQAFLFELERILRPGGLAIFSAHGPLSAGKASRLKSSLDEELIMAELQDSGISFIPYPHYLDKELGDTLFTRAYLERQLPTGLTIVQQDEACFWNSQDAYLLIRNPPTDGE
jgi:SAM-dependent methyltransferase